MENVEEVIATNEEAIVLTPYAAITDGEPHKQEEPFLSDTDDLVRSETHEHLHYATRLPDFPKTIDEDLLYEEVDRIYEQFGELKAEEFNTALLLPTMIHGGVYCNPKAYGFIKTSDPLQTIMESPEAPMAFSKFLATMGGFIVVSTNQNALNDWKDKILVDTNIGRLGARAVLQYAYSGTMGTLLAAVYMFDAASTPAPADAKKLAALKRGQLKNAVYRANPIFTKVPQREMDYIINGLFSDHQVLYYATTSHMFLPVFRRTSYNEEETFEADRNCRVCITNDDPTLTKQQIVDAEIYYSLMGINHKTREELIARLQLVKLRQWLYSHKEVSAGIRESRTVRRKFTK